MQDFRQGLTVTSTNPKVALLRASLSTFVGPAIAKWSYLILFTIGSAIMIFAIHGTYGWLFSTGHARGLYHRFQRTNEAVFGTLFGGLGIFMMNRSFFREAAIRASRSIDDSGLSTAIRRDLHECRD